MKTCHQCNNDISQKRKKSKFCSLSCSAKYNRLQVLQKNIPEKHKKCGKCLKIKMFTEFRKNKNSAFGYSYFCRECDSQRIYSRDKRKILFNAAKKRAKDSNLDFNLDLDDILLPKYCPVLGIELKFNNIQACDNSYSIDRIDSSKGYIKNNIQIISFKANTIKNNASFADIEKLYFFMKQNNKENK